MVRTSGGLVLCYLVLEDWREVDLACPMWDISLGCPAKDTGRRDCEGLNDVAESWEAVVSACRRARAYHAAFTLVGKELELQAIEELRDAGFGIREIARMTMVPRSTVSRLCQDLPASRRQLAEEQAGFPADLLEEARAVIREH